MATTHRLIFPDWYDERAEWEVVEKGWFSDAVVDVDGARYAITFYDPVRLRQNLEEEARGWLAEVGLIVLPELTRPAMVNAVAQIVDDGFFRTQLPIPADAGSNGDASRRTVAGQAGR
jgi:hypothetical protein